MEAIKDGIEWVGSAVTTVLPGGWLRSLIVIGVIAGAGGVIVFLPQISQSWSLATALSLLAWYVFAPQCLSTLAAVKRETGNWKMPLVIAGYLFGLAYLASFITYRIALSLGGG